MNKKEIEKMLAKSINENLKRRKNVKKPKDLLQIIKDEKITINYDNENNIVIGSVYPLSQELHDRIKGYFLKDDGYMGIEL